MESRRKLSIFSQNIPTKKSLKIHTHSRASLQQLPTDNHKKTKINRVNEVKQIPKDSLCAQSKCQSQYNRALELMKRDSQEDNDFNPRLAEQILKDLFQDKMLQFRTDQTNFALKESIILSYWKILDRLNNNQGIKLSILRRGYIYLLQCLPRLSSQKHNLCLLATLLAREEYTACNFKEALKICNEAITYAKRKIPINYSKLIKITYLKSKIYQALGETNEEIVNIKLCFYYLKKQTINSHTQITKEFIGKLVNRKNQLKMTEQDCSVPIQFKNRPKFTIRTQSQGKTKQEKVPEAKNPERKKSLQNLKQENKAQEIRSLIPKKNQQYSSFYKERVVFQRPKLKLKLELKREEPQQNIINYERQLKQAFLDVDNNKVQQMSRQLLQRRFCSFQKVKQELDPQPTKKPIIKNDYTIVTKPINQEQCDSLESDQDQKIETRKIRETLQKCAIAVQKEFLRKFSDSPLTPFLLNYNLSLKKQISLDKSLEKKQITRQVFEQDDDKELEIQKNDMNALFGAVTLLNYFQNCLENCFLNIEIGYLIYAKIIIKKTSIVCNSQAPHYKKILNFSESVYIQVKSEKYGIFQSINTFQNNENSGFSPQGILDSYFKTDYIISNTQDQFQLQFISLLRNYCKTLKRINGITLLFGLQTFSKKIKYDVKRMPIQLTFLYEQYTLTIQLLQKLKEFPQKVRYNYFYPNFNNKKVETFLQNDLKNEQVIEYIYFDSLLTKQVIIMSLPKEPLPLKSIIKHRISMNFQKFQQFKKQEQEFTPRQSTIQIKNYEAEISNPHEMFIKRNKSCELQNTSSFYNDIRIMLVSPQFSRLSLFFHTTNVKYWFNYNGDAYFQDLMVYQLKQIYISTINCGKLYKLIIKNIKLKNKQYTLIFNQQDLKNLSQIYPQQRLSYHQGKQFRFLQSFSSKLIIHKTLLCSKIGLQIQNQHFYLSNSYNDILNFKTTEDNCFLQKNSMKVRILCQKSIKLKIKAKFKYCIVTIYSILNTQMLHFYFNIPSVGRNYSVTFQQNILNYFNLEQIKQVFQPLKFQQNTINLEQKKSLLSLLKSNKQTSVFYWVKIIKSMKIQISNNQLFSYYVVKIANYCGILSDSTIYDYKSIDKQIFHIGISIHNQQEQKKVLGQQKMQIQSEFGQYYHSIFQSCINKYVVYLSLTDSQSLKRVNYKYGLERISSLCFLYPELAKNLDQKKSYHFGEYVFNFAILMRTLNMFKEKVFEQIKNTNVANSLFHDLSTKCRFNQVLKQKLKLYSLDKFSFNQSKIKNNNQQIYPEKRLIYKGIIKAHRKIIAMILFCRKSHKFQIYTTKGGEINTKKIEVSLDQCAFPYLKKIGDQNFLIIGKRLLKMYKNRILIMSNNL